ncbi:MAG TPA: hypothetical protein VIL46_17305, partial [Gemmataceae bacterium]
IGHCRHTEFLPLLLRAIARLPENSSGSRQLLATVYASSDTPAAGFDALADYLASADPASAPEVFDYWHSEEVDHQWFQEAVRDLKDLEAGKSNNPEYQKDPESWKTFLRADIDAFRNSERHFDTRPTPEQLARLREIPNVWVRSLVYSYYPEQCPPEWAIRC